MKENIKNEDIIYLGSAAYPEFKDYTIWRYMDLYKFENLLSESKLYLRRLELFNDFHEGTLTEASQISISFRAKEGIDLENYFNNINKIRKWSYANSWYIDNNISETMFNNFGPIVIKTKSLKLQESVSDCKIGQVKYINEHTYLPPDDPYFVCIHKRDTFKHERELRLVHVDNQINSKSIQEINSQEGIMLSVDLAMLIEEIYISKNRPNYLNDVKRLCNRYGIQKPIILN